MKIQHPAVASDVFKLVSTVEFDLSIGNQFLPTRVELFQDTERKRFFRCRMWERELHRIQSTFPQNSNGEPLHGPSDEELLVERTWELSSRFENFEAASADGAMRIFLSSLKEYLERGPRLTAAKENLRA